MAAKSAEARVHEIADRLATGSVTATLSAGDIEIGAVEIKNGTDDTRATVTAANALKVDGSAVTQPVSHATLAVVGAGVETSALRTTLATETLAALELVGIKGTDGAAIAGASNPLPTRISDGTDSVLVTAAGALVVDGSGVTQPVSGTVTANPTFPATATLANVTGNGTSQTIQAANTNRRNLMVFNDSGVVAYVKLGSAASSTSFTVKLQDQDFYELPQPIYTGIVTANWASGALRITEVAP